jgi:uncharacterized membrane protein (UPF0127 family)
MNRRVFLGLALAAPLTASLAGAPGLAQTAAQPELPTEPLTIVTRDGVEHQFQVEMAISPDQQRTGLMFRTSVLETGGMLFDWGRPQESQMWMKNTLVPLDMVFINQDGMIRSIAENTVPRSVATISSRGPVRATLELAAGTTAKLGVVVGDKVKNRIFGTSP